MSDSEDEDSRSSFSLESDSEYEQKNIKPYMTFRTILSNNDELFEKVKNVKSEKKLSAILENCNKSQTNSFLKMIDSIYMGQNVTSDYKRNKNFLNNLKKHCESFQNCGSRRKNLTRQKALEELKKILWNTDLKTFKSFFKAYKKKS